MRSTFVFGCGHKGNLYSLVKVILDTDFLTAQAWISTKAGLSTNQSLEALDFIKSIKDTLKVKNCATIEPKWRNFSQDEIDIMYQYNDPYDYLINRGYTVDTVKYFECGYTDQWYSKACGTDERITIPIKNHLGEIVGFAGRTPHDNIKPKYLYTAGLDKKHLIFNLNNACRYATKDGIILTEGTLDAIRVHQNGYPNVGAVLGAYLSDEAIKLLLKYTNTVFLAFDNDPAGKKNTKDVIEKLSELLSIFIIQLPNTIKDPGDIIDPKQWDDMVKSAKEWSTFKFLAELQ